MLIILSGASGVGKNTIIQKLIAQHKNLKYMRSATTRVRRPGEDNYLYLTKEEFLCREQKGEFFETQDVHGDYYGTLQKAVDKCVTENYIKDIDVFGSAKLKNYLKENAVAIFLEAPDDVLYDRLIKRGESVERAKVRLSRAEMERAHKHEYDFVIDNIDVDKTVDQINQFLKNKI